MKRILPLHVARKPIGFSRDTLYPHAPDRLTDDQVRQAGAHLAYSVLLPPRTSYLRIDGARGTYIPQILGLNVKVDTGSAYVAIPPGWWRKAHLKLFNAETGFVYGAAGRVRATVGFCRIQIINCPLESSRAERLWPPAGREGIVRACLLPGAGLTLPRWLGRGRPREDEERPHVLVGLHAFSDTRICLHLDEEFKEFGGVFRHDSTHCHADRSGQ